eukprot:Nk52_evm12s370 gene=Nk52_evmTU12s370
MTTPACYAQVLDQALAEHAPEGQKENKGPSSALNPELKIVQLGTSGKLDIRLDDLNGKEKSAFSEFLEFGTHPLGAPPLLDDKGLSLEGERGPFDSFLEDNFIGRDAGFRNLGIHQDSLSREVSTPDSIFWSELESLIENETEPLFLGSKAEKNPVTGEITGAIFNFGGNFGEQDPFSGLNESEVGGEEEPNEAQSSQLSLNRDPGAKSDFVRGQSSNLPFMPGGMNDSISARQKILKEKKDEKYLGASKNITSPIVVYNPEDSANSEPVDIDISPIPRSDRLRFPPGMEVGLAVTETESDECTVDLVKFSTVEDTGIGSNLDEGIIESSVTKRNDIVTLDSIMEDGVEEYLYDISAQKMDQALQKRLHSEHASIFESKGLGSDLQEDGTNSSEADNNTKALTAVLSLNSDALEQMREYRKLGGADNQLKWAKVIDVGVRISAEEFQESVPDMAFQYPFELDTFQKQAVMHLERHDSVFIAAHTSAGKTVVAEYAIALCMKHMTRAIYTSPIKALSNQKFRDFSETFDGDVGLLTGDIQLKPESSCLIMTTEILRSMLYRGADIIRDVEWVIFDEVHYVNDSERGVVWEEVIIMLPEHINIILLSATVPNTTEFAEWIGRTKEKEIYVISTLKRPVPLEHFLYTGNSPKTNNELFKIVSADKPKEFINAGYKKAYDVAQSKKSDSKSKQFGPKSGQGGRSVGPARGGDRNVYISLVDMLTKNTMTPVVVFTFSRKRCEENADGLCNSDLTSASEKSEIHLFIEHALSRLKGCDRKLPQVLRMRDMLKIGIGVHHSGLLPIIKEMVEMLFQKGLVKVLFATETFAMGVNMPAKTVVFDTIRKHDGQQFRELLPGEYTQMAGRAGRRGLDATGTVIILCKSGANFTEASVLHSMILGKPTLLTSQFRLTYLMILNLLRVEELRVEDMMKRSFAEFNTQNGLSAHAEELKVKKKLLKELEKEIEGKDGDNAFGTCDFCVNDLEDYCKAVSDINKCTRNMMVSIARSNAGQAKALVPGRVVVVDRVYDIEDTSSYFQNIAGVLLKTVSVSGVTSLTVLLPIPKGTRIKFGKGKRENVEKTHNPLDIFVSFSDNVEELGCVVEEIPIDSLVAIAETRLKCSENDVASVVLWDKEVKKKDVNEGLDVSMKRFGEMSLISKKKDFENEKNGTSANSAHGEKTKKVLIQQLIRLVEDTVSSGKKDGSPLLKLECVDPVKDMKLTELEFVETSRRVEGLKELLPGFSSSNCPELANHFVAMQKRIAIGQEIAELKYSLSDQSLHLLPDYHNRVAVLQNLNYIGQDLTTQLKGRVACEVSTCDELIVTELIFENVFTNMKPAEVVALLSSLVFQAKSECEPELTTALTQGRDRFVSIAEGLASEQVREGLDTPADVYIKNTLNFGLVEVVYEWANGMPFDEIARLTDVLEGTIVRCITRLEETCRDLRNAARVIGDPVLYRKMEEASSLIKRDIVFAASLYTM